LLRDRIEFVRTGEDLEGRSRKILMALLDLLGEIFSCP